MLPSQLTTMMLRMEDGRVALSKSMQRTGTRTRPSPTLSKS